MDRRFIYLLIFTSLLITGLLFTFHRLGFLPFSPPAFIDWLQPPVQYNIETGPKDLVPNIVHFIRFGETPMTFVEAVCVLAALKNQNPRVVMFHTDQRDFDGGKYWKTVKAVGGKRIVVLYKKKPTHVNGRPLAQKWLNYHAGDVARLEVLMEFGGIYLDNDSYIVKSLDEYRKFKMTLSWPEGNLHVQNQVLIARKDAEFLRLWLESYQDDYRDNIWNYNAQRKPQLILTKYPHLINRVKEDLVPPKWLEVFPMLYLEKSDAWRRYHAIHLFIRHQSQIGKKTLSEKAKYPVEFDEKNILDYDVNIKYMALDVWPKPFPTYQNDSTAIPNRINNTDA